MNKKFLLSAACMIVLLGSGISRAQEPDPADYAAHPKAWRLFVEYAHREPCQHYVEPPAGFVLRGCKLFRADSAVAQGFVSMQETQPVQWQKVVADKSAHTIYFDFNKSDIRPSEEHKIDSVAQEIRDYEHEHVTVAGHTDSSGPDAYNMELSKRRVHVIAEALIERGIKKEVLNEVLDNKAYGETDQAVQTHDGVKMPENRRTVINFTN
jgi:outer membrane protein OmpA-like peptidoglycan-associated protein